MRFSVQRTEDFTKVRSIRIKIFNKELGLSKSDIFGDDDKKLEQFLIMSDEKIVGTFRLREINDSYKIERMGILSEYRLRGFGKLTLEAIKAHSKKKNR
jgi:predicted GNAT family N-acyltransferase